MRRLVGIVLLFTLLAVTVVAAAAYLVPHRLAAFRGGAAASYAPPSGYAIWLKPESLSGADGDAVSSWADSSGNGYNATGGGAAANPVLTNNLMGSYEGVCFDGDNDIMSFGGGALGVFNNVGGGTFVIVGRYNGGDDAFDTFVYFSDGANGASARFTLQVSSSPSFYIRGRAVDGAGISASDALSIVQAQFLAMVAIADYADTAAYIRTNNVAAMSDITWADSTLTSATDSLLASIGGYSGNYLKCVIVEVLIYGKKLSAGELSTLDSYLRNKYGEYSTW